MSSLTCRPNGALLHPWTVESTCNVQKEFALATRCAPTDSYITHIDFSDDGTKIQANTGNHELLFYETETGDLVSSPSAVKNVDWDGWTCTLGWPVQGIWPDPNDAAPSPSITACHRSSSNALLACADEYGGVKVFRYPCLERVAKYADLQGHALHVTSVRFNANDTYLFSLGGSDRALMQWRLSGEKTRRLMSTALSGASKDDTKESIDEKTK